MKIGKVSKDTGIGIHAIRFYEKQGLIRQPLKDISGHRNYSHKDVELLNWIACMKNSGMPLSRIQQYSQAYYSDDSVACLALLNEHLLHLKQQQSDLEHYIDVTEIKISKLR
jgi:MerR family transcriptional regulator, aldehyde-responsive regulator